MTACLQEHRVRPRSSMEYSHLCGIGVEIGMKLLFILGVEVVRPQYKPVNSDSLGTGHHQVETLATIAQQRLAIVKFEDDRFCSEPAPDVSDSVSAALAAALTATQGKVEATASVSMAFAQYAKPLFYRSQGVQLYRDGTYALCNAYLNGAISQQVYSESHKALLEAAQRLIHGELPFVKDIKSDLGAPPTANLPPGQSSSPSKSTGASPGQSASPKDAGAPAGQQSSGPAIEGETPTKKPK